MRPTAVIESKVAVHARALRRTKQTKTNRQSEFAKGGTMSNGSTQKLTLFALTAMVVGGMVGSGIFSLPRTFGNATGPFGAIIAWCIAAGGMYCLARVFQFT